MVSSLDGIFPGLPPRHVESANARLEIRRDETQQHGKKKDEASEGEYSPIPWEDISYVSIASLRVFLESVLIPEGEILPTQPHVHEASNTINQRAVSAYQSIGRAGHDENVYAPTPETPATHIETNFSDTDLARIRVFVADLADLERRGINELAMQRSTNFLDSIETAIQTSKNT